MVSKEVGCVKGCSLFKDVSRVFSKGNIIVVLQVFQVGSHDGSTVF